MSVGSAACERLPQATREGELLRIVQTRNPGRPAMPLGSTRTGCLGSRIGSVTPWQRFPIRLDEYSKAGR